MKIKKPVLIVLGEPNSVFTEILSKTFLNNKLTNRKINYPIILIGSKNLIVSQLKKLKLNLNFKEINNEKKISRKLKNQIYLINVDYKFKKPFDIISSKSKKYISDCFKIALNYLNSEQSEILINGPISKKHFLDNKYPGITEYIFNKSKKKISSNPVMLIFNKKFSVSPLTTHIPLKEVNKRINIKKIVNNALVINNFYKKNLKKKPRFALIGLNPHCESSSKYNEEEKIIIPAIKNLKKKMVNIEGPFPADTFFLKKNLKKYQSVIGMYHDQVLTPFKTLFGFNASNITLGLPFLRISVDHGPNQNMIGKNKSNSDSLESIFHLINSLK